MDVADRKRITHIDHQLAALLKQRATATAKLTEQLLNIAEIDDAADLLLDERLTLYTDHP